MLTATAARVKRKSTVYLIPEAQLTFLSSQKKLFTRRRIKKRRAHPAALLLECNKRKRELAWYTSREH
jgi:hypothetical protein